MTVTKCFPTFEIQQSTRNTNTLSQPCL